MPNIRSIQAKSILNRSKIFDYCVNPYTGCQIGCHYCYARLFMGRYSGHTEPWGTFVDAKINAADLLRRQTERGRIGRIWLSSVCDPYQPLEARLALTRSCLEVLVQRRFPVTIQTKSDLVKRDLDLIRRLEAVEVGVTVTTEDERTAKLFEPGASPIAHRLSALEAVHAAGVTTYAFVGPLLPGDPERLADRLDGRVDRVIIDRLNYPHTAKRFYRRHGLEWALTPAFFSEQRDRLMLRLQQKQIACEALF